MTSPDFVLKFNRQTIDGLICLNFWVQLARVMERRVVLLTDLWAPGDVHAQVRGVFRKYGVEPDVANTDYTLTRDAKFARPASTRWLRIGAANLTAYRLARTRRFWLVDADDTLFYDDAERLAWKFTRAEAEASRESMAGFSYAFFRHLPIDHWSFGVALMDREVDLEVALQVPHERILALSVADNIDGAFDVLRRSGTWNLRSFVFDGSLFHHHLAATSNWVSGTSYGVYRWNGRRLFGLYEAPADVVVI